MARYDRIARLAPPKRDQVFTGWYMVRDLEGRERDTDLGRRARLRFLAVRLLNRMMRWGKGMDEDSLHRQADAVREELGQLPSRDPDRERIAELLKHVGSMDMGGVAESALAMAEAAAADGHPYAAEEWYRTAYGLADAADLQAMATAAAAGLTRLGVV